MHTRHFLWFILLVFTGSAYGNNLSIELVKEDASEWYLLESDHFNFYFSDSSTRLAKAILPASINKLNQIEEKIGYRLSGKINIFVHASGAELNATYANYTEEQRYNIGGITHVQNNDVHVYETGEIPTLMNQISVGIADNLILEMLYGGTIQERIKYASVLHLPVWFQAGLVEYLAKGWNSESDNLLRDAFNNQQFKSYNTLTPSQQKLIGQNIWFYINDIKTDDAIQRILYLVRLTRKVETALYYVLNITSKQLYSEWYIANQGLYSAELKRRIPQDPENNPFNPIEDVLYASSLSPNAENIVSAYYHNGETRLEIYNRENHVRNILRKEFVGRSGRKHVEGESLVVWKNDSEFWLVVNNVQPTLELLDIEGNVIIPPIKFKGFDFIHGIDFYNSDNVFVFAGIKEGHSQLFLSNVNLSRIEPLSTTDHDDLEPQFDESGNIYFTRIVYKNEEKKYINDWQKDIFYIFRNGFEALSCNNVTNTPNINEECPLKLNSKYLSFISDKNGIRNAYAYKLNQETFALSNYQTGILKQQICKSRTHVLETVLHNGYIFTHVSAVDSSKNFGAILNPSKTKSYQKVTDAYINASKNNPVSQNSDSLNQQETVYFQSNFPVPKNIDSLESISQEKLKKLNYDFESVQENFSGLRVTKIISQINNSNFLTDEFGAEFDPINQMRNKIGVAGGVGLSDQFNNHLIEGKMRTLFNLSIFQFALSYENRVGNINKKISVLSEHTNYNQNFDIGIRRMRAGKVEFTKKMSSALSLAASQQTRFDHFTPIIQDESFLKLKEKYQLTLDQELKAVYSTKLAYQDILFTGFNAEVSTNFRYNASETASSIISKLKMKHGYKVFKHLLWINSAEIGNSTGGTNTIFVVGGNMNQYRPTISDTRITIDNASFISPVYGVRNFNINTRSGNTYGFLNSELWAPLNRYAGKKPIKNAWIQNLWMVGFIDAGTAWYGTSPKSRSNVANVKNVADGRLDITVFNAKNPMVYSGGLGLRTKVFGYFVRYDLAWTYDNNVWQKAVGRVSLGKSIF